MYTYAYIPVYTGKDMSGKLYHRIKKVDGKWTWRPCLGDLCLICDGHMDTRNDPIDFGGAEE